jgi:hypothetical protein
MLAHFVTEMLGFRAPARSRSESNVRHELCDETAKIAECSKAAGAFQQSRRPVGTRQTHFLGGPVYGNERRECPHPPAAYWFA